MPIDPAIANPPTIKLADPAEQMSTALKNAYLMQEIEKVKQARDDQDTYRGAYSIPGLSSMTPTERKNALIDNVVTAKRGDLVPQILKGEQELEEKAAKVGLDKANTGKATADTIETQTKAVAQEIKNTRNDLMNIDINDPTKGLSGYENFVKSLYNNKVLGPRYTEIGKTPEMWMDKARAEASKGQAAWANFMLGEKMGPEQADKLAENIVTKVTQIGKNGGQVQNVVATNKYGDPAAHVVPGSEQSYVPSDHSTKIYMPGQPTQNEYEKKRGELMAGTDHSLYMAAQNAPRNIEMAQKIKTLIQAGAITGKGSDLKVDALAFGKAFGFNVPNDPLVATQMLKKMMAQNVFGQVGIFKEAGVPMNRLTNLDLTLTKEGTPQMDLDPQTINWMADEMIDSSKEAVRRNNDRNSQIRSSKVSSSPQVLGIAQDVPMPPGDTSGNSPIANVSGNPSVNPKTGKPWPIPPQKNIDLLKSDSSKRALFESHYGPADKYLGKQQPGGGGAPTLPSPQGGAAVAPVFDQPLHPTVQEQYQPAAVNYKHGGGAAQWGPVVDAASRQTGVPAGIIEAVIHAESSGNPGATSPVGAQGLMQLMPGTAHGLGVKDAYDPYQNILGGAKYLRQLYSKFGNWRDAVAAYNAGPDDSEATPYKRIGPFAKSHDDARYRVWENPQNGGYAETRNYVEHIQEYLKRAQERGYGKK